MFKLSCIEVEKKTTYDDKSYLCTQKNYLKYKSHGNISKQQRVVLDIPEGMEK